MRRLCACALTVLFFLSIASSIRAGDVTIDSLNKAQVPKTSNYTVIYSGTLKLTDTGGGYEKWVGVACTVYQKGQAPITMSISSLTPPTLTADGSYTATGTVTQNVLDANWTATATITWYVDANTTNSKTAYKDFTIP